jgi:hypothetical protein
MTLAQFLLASAAGFVVVAAVIAGACAFCEFLENSVGDR